MKCLKKSADFKELRIQVLGWDEYKYDDAADALESACRLAKRIYLSRRSRQRNVKNAERHKRRNIKNLKKLIVGDAMATNSNKTSISITKISCTAQP